MEIVNLYFASVLAFSPHRLKLFSPKQINENEKKNTTTTAGSKRSPFPMKGRGRGKGYLNKDQRKRIALIGEILLTR